MTVIEMPKTAPPRVKREFLALDEKGVFARQRVNLFRGEILEIPILGILRTRSLMAISNWMFASFRPALQVRIRLPFDVPGQSLVEPDAALVSDDQLSSPQTQCAWLVVEIADEFFEFAHKKIEEYAAARVSEYWIVDVIAKKLEVYRDPIADAATPLGFRYASHQVLAEHECVSPLVRSEIIVAVKALLGSP